MRGLFGRSRALEAQLDEYFDKVSESALLFKQAVGLYLSKGATDDFEGKLYDVNKHESEADHLRRNIERQLYTQTLIPDSRGDVLGLLENLDEVLNALEGVLWAFSIEAPEIPSEYHEDYETMADLSLQGVESIVQASRAFFRNIEAVGDHNHKVSFFETEADKAGTKLKRAIFRSDLPLSHKAQLRNFVELIDEVADKAEDVAERLAIYTIKRTI